MSAHSLRAAITRIILQQSLLYHAQGRWMIARQVVERVVADQVRSLGISIDVD